MEYALIGVELDESPLVFRLLNDDLDDDLLERLEEDGDDEFDVIHDWFDEVPGNSGNKVLLLAFFFNFVLEVGVLLSQMDEVIVLFMPGNRGNFSSRSRSSNWGLFIISKSFLRSDPCGNSLASS